MAKKTPKMPKMQDCDYDMAEDVKAMPHTAYLDHFKQGKFLQQGHNTPAEDVQEWFRSTVQRAKDALGFAPNDENPEPLRPGDSQPLPPTMEELVKKHERPFAGQKGRPGLWK